MENRNRYACGATHSCIRCREFDGSDQHWCCCDNAVANCETEREGPYTNSQKNLKLKQFLILKNNYNAEPLIFKSLMILKKYCNLLQRKSFYFFKSVILREILKRKDFFFQMTLWCSFIYSLFNNFYKATYHFNLHVSLLIQALFPICGEWRAVIFSHCFILLNIDGFIRGDGDIINRRLGVRRKAQPPLFFWFGKEPKSLSHKPDLPNWSKSSSRTQI